MAEKYSAICVSVLFGEGVRFYMSLLIEYMDGFPINLSSNCTIIGKILPKGVGSFDFIATFAMSFFCLSFKCSTKIGKIADMAKSLATFCC